VEIIAQLGCRTDKAAQLLAKVTQGTGRCLLDIFQAEGEYRNSLMQKDRLDVNADVSAGDLGSDETNFHSKEQGYACLSDLW
jgi:hypothetical protein